MQYSVSNVDRFSPSKLNNNQHDLSLSQSFLTSKTPNRQTMNSVADNSYIRVSKDVSPPNKLQS